MQKLCCVRTRQQFSASLVHFLSRSPPFLNQFSSIFGGNCIIMANAQYRSDFSACVNLFKTFLEQMENKAGTLNLQVAAVHQGSNDHNADLSMEDRYYKKSEYDQLTGAQKKGLKLKQEKRGHKPG